MNEILNLMKCFSDSFINPWFEVILSLNGNVYFRAYEGITREEIECKIFEACSRSCAKGEPYKSESTNHTWRDKIISGFNSYLGTQFTQDDFYRIYDALGNGINHDLTLKFIRSGYDLNLLDLQEESTWFSTFDREI